MFPRSSTWSEVAAETPADQGDARRINFWVRARVVDYRSYDVLPVRSHVYPLLVEHSSLAGAIEDQAVGPSAHGCDGMAEVHPLYRGVVAVGSDNRRAWPGRVGYAGEGGGGGGGLVGGVGR